MIFILYEKKNEQKKSMLFPLKIIKKLGISNSLKLI